MNQHNTSEAAQQREMSRLARGIAADERKGRERPTATLEDPSAEARGGQRRKLHWLAGLAVVLAGLTAANLAGFNPLVRDLPPPTIADIELAALGAVESVVDGLYDGYEESGAFPESIEDFVEPIGAWNYVRSESGGFRVSLVTEDTTVVFDSFQDRDAFFERLYRPREERP